MLSNISRRLFSSSSHSSSSYFGRSLIPSIKNEPMLSYAPGSAERAKLQSAIEKIKGTTFSIPSVVDGREYRDGKPDYQYNPCNKSQVVAEFFPPSEELIGKSIDGALKARKEWQALPFESRAAVFLKAADLLSGKYRYDLMAATMVGQGKNCWQAEIDAAAEAIDFWRFNCQFAAEIYATQPRENSPGFWNRMEYRPLDGFVMAVTPFNFTAIGVNLVSAPALMGNTVIWKPSSTAILSNFKVLEILREAGLPDGVIQFVPGRGGAVSDVALKRKEFAGLHFTGSTATFNTLWGEIGQRLGSYSNYPRIVGETGGKNFHFAHNSADIENFVHQTIRSAFEYSGQKCSACSRAYVPKSIWPQVKARLVEVTNKIIKEQFGDVTKFSTFLGAVIDERSWKRLDGVINKVKAEGKAQIIVGGRTDKSVGYFIEPTIVVTEDPLYFTMRDEFFGPILSVHVYDDAKFAETLEICDKTSSYALTGAIFARSRTELEQMTNALVQTAGNTYINRASTGAVVGQQPFGGARASGTNDKAGSILNLWRWVSARTIAESHVPITDYQYPSMK